MKSFVTETFTCNHCGYIQDFDPNNEEKMNEVFPGYPAGKCPACLIGKNPDKTKGVRNLSKIESDSQKTIINVAEASDYEDVEVADKGSDGLPKKDSKGENLQRKLTDQEKAERAAEAADALERASSLKELP